MTQNHAEKHDPDVDYDPTDVWPLSESMRASGVHVLDTNIDYDAEPKRDPRTLAMLAKRVL
jgi:hypothetical protein